jgi:phage tail-like protein
VSSLAGPAPGLAGPTPELIARMRRLIWAGNRPESAARLCGIDAPTFHRWVRRGEHHARTRGRDRDETARGWVEWLAAARLEPHRNPLAAGLPSIFQPILTRDEAATVRTVAEAQSLDGAAQLLDRPLAELELVYEAAAAKLGDRLDDAAFAVRSHELLVRTRQDDFITRLCNAFDEVLVPIAQTLDTLGTLVNPGLCPPEFLPWLARLVALDRYADWPAPALRRLLAAAVGLYRTRGTARALAAVLKLYAEGPDAPASVSVEDPGESWVAGDEPRRGRKGHRVRVRITGARRPADDVQFRSGLDQILSLFLPAHVVAELEVQAA